jgi:DNA-directed RNA polymerase subunit M/transcription elongation factor TFIIS
MSQKAQGLNREFSEKDIQRMRNLVQGKYGEKNEASVGYSKPDDFYKEGDVWEHDDRTWTIKEGIKQNITKLDKAKKVHNMPLFCPKCGALMKNRNDKEFYKIHKTCFRCVVLKEDKLKREGKFDEYQRKIKNDEIDNKITDFKAYVRDKLNEKNDFITEAGDIEKWRGNINEEQVEDHVSTVIEYLEGLKK